MLRELFPAFRMMLFLTIATGLIYPAVVTGLCQALFHDEANGSLVKVNGQAVGSTLIGQNFAKPEYFHPRPSAAGNGYDPTSSGGSNLGPTSQKLHDRVKAGAEQFRKENPDYHGDIPADAITASGSGLDPEITVANALAQAPRVAKARGLNTADVESLVTNLTQSRDLGLFGEARVNVLQVNLALDQKYRKAS
jgi:potassium-transporting ATPase KdpC subunit